MTAVSVNAILFEDQLRDLAEEVSKLTEFETITLQVTFCSPMAKQLAVSAASKIRLLSALSGSSLVNGDPVVITQDARESGTRKEWHGSSKLQVRIQVDRRTPVSNAIVLSRDGSVTFIAPAS